MPKPQAKKPDEKEDALERLAKHKTARPRRASALDLFSASKVNAQLRTQMQLHSLRALPHYAHMGFNPFVRPSHPQLLRGGGGSAVGGGGMGVSDMLKVMDQVRKSEAENVKSADKLRELQNETLVLKTELKQTKREGDLAAREARIEEKAKAFERSTKQQGALQKEIRQISSQFVKTNVEAGKAVHGSAQTAAALLTKNADLEVKAKKGKGEKELETIESEGIRAITKTVEDTEMKEAKPAALKTVRKRPSRGTRKESVPPKAQEETPKTIEASPETPDDSFIPPPPPTLTAIPETYGFHVDLPPGPTIPAMPPPGLAARSQPATKTAAKNRPKHIKGSAVYHAKISEAQHQKPFPTRFAVKKIVKNEEKDKDTVMADEKDDDSVMLDSTPAKEKAPVRVYAEHEYTDHPLAPNELKIWGVDELEEHEIQQQGIKRPVETTQEEEDERFEDRSSGTKHIMLPRICDE